VIEVYCNICHSLCFQSIRDSKVSYVCPIHGLRKVESKGAFA